MCGAASDMMPTDDVGATLDEDVKVRVAKIGAPSWAQIYPKKRRRFMDSHSKCNFIVPEMSEMAQVADMHGLVVSAFQWLLACLLIHFISRDPVMRNSPTRQQDDVTARTSPRRRDGHHHCMGIIPDDPSRGIHHRLSHHHESVVLPACN